MSNKIDIPLMSTQTITLSDLNSQKGFYASAGYRIVNAGLLSSGVISGI